MTTAKNSDHQSNNIVSMLFDGTFTSNDIKWSTEELSTPS